MSDTQRRRSIGLLVMAPFVEIFLLALVVVLLQNPSFGIRTERLPSSRAAKNTKTNSDHTIVLQPEGTLLWDGSPIEVQQLIKRIEQSTANESILLGVESSADGQGNLRAYLELQSAVAEAGVWNRLHLAHRPREGEGDRP